MTGLVPLPSLRSPQAVVRQTLLASGVNPSTLRPSLVERWVAQIEARRDVAGMNKAFRAAWYSLLRQMTSPADYRREMAAISAPVLLVEGARDRLVPPYASRDVARRNPRWTDRELDGVGHVPQIEVPEQLAPVVLDWLSAVSALLPAA